MKLQLESSRLGDYLVELPPYVEWHSSLVKSHVAKIMGVAQSAAERARMAFEVARDGVAHSFDTGHPVVSIGAEETLRNGEGICFAKSHFLFSAMQHPKNCAG